MFHSYYFLVFILFSPLMLLSNWVTGRRSGRKQHEEAERRYTRRLAALEQEVREAVARERRIRDVTGPDPAAAALTATGPGGRLWERRRHDPDHLVLRLGTADQPSLKELEDPSREENHRTIRWNIPDVPVGVDIPAHGVVGVAGPWTDLRTLARWLVIQAAVLHSPRDLRIVVLTERDREAGWDWVRWLPHLRPMASHAPGGAAGPAVLLGNDEASTTARVSELVSQVQSRRRAAARARPSRDHRTRPAGDRRRGAAAAGCARHGADPHRGSRGADLQRLPRRAGTVAAGGVHRRGGRGRAACSP